MKKLILISLLLPLSVSSQLFFNVGVYRNHVTTIYTTIGCEIPIKNTSFEGYISLPFWRGDDQYNLNEIVHLSGSGMLIGASVYYHVSKFDIGITGQYRTDVYIVPKTIAPYTYEFYEITYPVFLIVNYNLWKDQVKIGGDISYNQVGIHIKLLINLTKKRTICDLW